jgi:branched-chain amino acid transport system ATP-binding protein
MIFLPNMNPILRVQNLSIGYGKKQVLYEINLDVMQGEVILVSGGNGSGKSTLFKAIYGLIKPWNANAKILFCPEPQGPVLTTYPANINLRNGLYYIPQKNAVFEELTVDDNLLLAGHLLNNKKSFYLHRKAVLDFFPSIVPLLKRKLEKMSGGERQLVTLAMAMLNRPRLLLLDEPAAGLSEENIDLLIERLIYLHDILDINMLIIEHRFSKDIPIISRSVNLKLGKIHYDSGS